MIGGFAKRLGAAFCVACAAAAGAAAQQAVELELVLAVDVSSSVDDDEYFLQMYGLAQAFRHPDVLAAVRNAGGLAVCLVQWSDSSKHAVAVDWTEVHDDATAAAFANAVVAAPRAIVGGQTSISGAIRFAMREIDRNAYDGRRRTIDISGDGRANAGSPPQRARQERRRRESPSTASPSATRNRSSTRTSATASSPASRRSSSSPTTTTISPRR